METTLLFTTVLALAVRDISSENEIEVPDKCSCINNLIGVLPGPELLYVTSKIAVLRATSCSFECLAEQKLVIEYYYQGKREEQSRNLGRQLVFSIAYKDIQSPIANVQSLGKLSSGTSIFSNFTFVRFCSDAPLDVPKNVTCWWNGTSLDLQWSVPLPNRECDTITQYVVKKNIVGTNEYYRWYWLGEVMVRESGTKIFDEKLKLCPDKRFLCASFHITWDYTRKIQLGVRRIDQNESMIRSTPTECIHGLRPSPSTIPPDGRHNSPNPQKSRHQGNGTLWKYMALSSTVALIITIIMLPLAFFAGSRYRRKHSNSAVTWRRMSGNNMGSNTNSSNLQPRGEEFPPAYAYDYAVPQRPPMMQPPPLPPLREDFADYEGNEFYGTEVTSIGLPIPSYKRN